MNNLTRKQLNKFEKLETFSVYLCGPIKDCVDKEIHQWRNGMKTILSPYPGVTVRDPTDRDYRSRLIQTPFDELEELDEEIVILDEKEITLSEALIFNCHMASAGSSMEIYNAWHAKKCVITVVYSIRNVSPWIRYHSTIMVETMHHNSYAQRVVNILNGIFPKTFENRKHAGQLI